MSDTPDWKILTSALYLNGRRFLCSCGCNVFHEYKKEPGVYYCNGCPARYEGLKEVPDVE